MGYRAFAKSTALLSLAWLLMAAETSLVEGVSRNAKARAAANDQSALDLYVRARRGFEEEARTYWTSVGEKRRLRNAKRGNKEQIRLEDYVLSQPPIYNGATRPTSPVGAGPKVVEPSKPVIPVAADFLKAAREQFGFVPQRPPSELAFKKEYANEAAAAGLTRDQVVRIYAFETGGNGTYDAQAGLIGARPGARAISPAVGYNQLLSTNSVELLADHGERFIGALQQKADALVGEPRRVMEQKIAALRRMVEFSRTVPNLWSEHDHLAKNTPGGIGIHAAILDRDIGPLLQVQKLLDSVLHARSKGYDAPLAAAELEVMNFTGDGNGLDMIMMPPALRQRVPTANFFERAGYERNPIARRTGVVAALFVAINARMDQALQSRGAKELAAAF
jgi:hypothetical protein